MSPNCATGIGPEDDFFDLGGDSLTAAVLGAKIHDRWSVDIYLETLTARPRLEDLARAGAGDRAASVAREMTKQFEEVRRGTVAELAAYYSEQSPRGEFVIVLGPADARMVDESVVRERVRALRAEGQSARDTAAIVAKELGVSKKVAYRMANED